MNQKLIYEDSQELWTRFREGDAYAYSNIVRNFSNSLFKYGVRIINDEDFVKDCMQDVFFKLWHHRQNIGHTPAVKSYLLKALRSRLFRERNKWHNTDHLNEDYSFTVEFNIENRLIEDQISKETKLKIERVLNKLPKRQKEIIYLRYYENLPLEQIAQIMGVNQQSVYNLLHNATSRLRKEWIGEVNALFLISLIHAF
jgi:RNA polymerase sigma factor (sigma-70 family)